MSMYLIKIEQYYVNKMNVSSMVLSHLVSRLPRCFIRIRKQQGILKIDLTRNLTSIERALQNYNQKENLLRHTEFIYLNFSDLLKLIYKTPEISALLGLNLILSQISTVNK